MRSAPNLQPRQPVALDLTRSGLEGVEATKLLGGADGARGYSPPKSTATKAIPV